MSRAGRRTLGVTGALTAAVTVLAFLPSPTPALDPGPVWRQTARLSGTAPSQEAVRRGKGYSPIGVVLLDQLLGLGWDTDPSGATATREFGFADEAAARTAAGEAISAGRQNGFAMQAGELWQVLPDAWQDDGWSPDRKVRYVVTLLRPRTDGRWTVHLLLEHTY